MNQIPKRLKKEPLIEAIWQVQFEPKPGLPAGDLLPGVLYSALKTDHSALQLHRLPPAEMPAPVAQIDPNLKFAAKYRMDESDSPFLYQVGDRVVTVNCRKPYAGWPTFKDKILKLIDIIENSGLVPVPLRHSLRYIDLLTLESAPDLSALQLDLKSDVGALLEDPYGCAWSFLMIIFLISFRLLRQQKQGCLMV